MKKCIVTTTIYTPSEATLKYAMMEDWEFLIVGDQKTPHKDYDDLSYKYENVRYLSPEYQDSHYNELSEAIGWNKVMRRNIGFVEAYRRGADVVATIDDDNIPFENWGKKLYIGQELSIEYWEHPSGVFDPMELTNHCHLWHRGYPLDLIGEKDDVMCLGYRNHPKVLFQADLWDGDPDIDAVCRKMYNPSDLNLEVEEFFTTTDYTPFNSQNTFIAREALPYYMVLPYVGRMDDIWGGYIAQYLLNTRPIFGPPTVYQDRNEQDVNKNLRDEVLGYTTTLQMLRDMDNWEKYLPEQALNAFNIYRKQYD